MEKLKVSQMNEIYSRWESVDNFAYKLSFVH